jgi:hypothetical protein
MFRIVRINESARSFVHTYLPAVSSVGMNFCSPFKQNSANGLPNAAGSAHDQSGLARKFLADVLPSIQ